MPAPTRNPQRSRWFPGLHGHSGQAAAAASSAPWRSSMRRARAMALVADLGRVEDLDATRRCAMSRRGPPPASRRSRAGGCQPSGSPTSSRSASRTACVPIASARTPEHGRVDPHDDRDPRRVPLVGGDRLRPVAARSKSAGRAKSRGRSPYAADAPHAIRPDLVLAPGDDVPDAALEHEAERLELALDGSSPRR